MPAEVSRIKLAPTADVHPVMVNVIDSLRSIVQALRSANRNAEQKLGISSAQLYVLQELKDRPALSINDLAQRTFTHQSSVSMVVRKLVESRLVTRTAARSDARKTSISITAAGRTLLRRSPTAAQTTLVGALRQMPAGELRTLSTALTNLTTRMAEQEQRSKPRPRMKGSLSA